MQRLSFKMVTFVVLCIVFGHKALASSSAEIQQKIQTATVDFEQRYPQRWTHPNQPTPSLGPILEEALNFIENNASYKARSRKDLAFKALWIQTINHLQHSSFSFEKEAPNYTHKDLFEGRYPLLPVLSALKKTEDFFLLAEIASDTSLLERIAPNPELEKSLLTAQQVVAKEIIQKPLVKYLEFRKRLIKEGPNAKFMEFASMVEYLLLKLRSDEGLIETSTHNPLIKKFRSTAIKQLIDVRNRQCPYMETIDAVERTMEFLDVYHRAKDPARSPVLYHSGRYQYYLHYLKGTVPDHILFPSLAMIGATDLLKVRGVPIGFAGVNTEIAYVDGYFQTPFEFYIHDINHSRRMFLFFEKAAKKYGWSITEMAEHSDKFVRETLIPLISINPKDSREVKNRKRLMKILFFEVLHEDALAALPSIIEEAILRKAGVLTPFERIDNDRKVVYVMEPGASTLAYVFRKLAHDFYDMPGDRFNNIVEPEFRTYEHILEATVELMKGLGLQPNREQLNDLLKQDTGFPQAFNETLQRDNLKRAKDTIPLISSERAFSLAKKVFRTSPEATAIDESRPMEIINFFRDRNRINVQLRVPVKDERNIIEVLVPVQEELYSVNPTNNTVEQMHGERRIIEIRSGKYLNLATLKKEFLSRLSSQNYLITIRSDDPEANNLIMAAKEYGLETVLAIDVKQPRQSTEVSPTYYATMPNKSSMTRFWNQLMKTPQNNTSIKNLRLEYDQPLSQGYTQIFSSLESERLNAHRRIEDVLVAKGISIINLQDFENRFGKNKTPIALGVPVSTSWEKLTNDERLLLQRSIERTIDGLDSQRVVIVTGGGNSGLEKIIHNAAKNRGIHTLGTFAESSDLNNIGDITHAAIVSRDWFGKAQPVLKFIKQHNGYAAYFSGGKILENEIQLAKNIDVDHFLMSGANGAAHEAAKTDPKHAFKNADELLGLIFEKSPHLVLPDYKLTARDSLFQRYAEKISAQGTKILSYQSLVEASRGLKTIILNGYVGLGYEHPKQVRKAIRDLMKREGDNVLFVGVGTHSGIGLAYDWIPQIAKELKFSNIKTAAIVSRNVAKLELGPMDFVHFANNEVNNWRPTQDGEDLQVHFLKDTGGKLICYGGGERTGIVALNALSAGMPVEIYTGDAIAPNSVDVKNSLQKRLDKVIDGTQALVAEQKRYRNLKVFKLNIDSQLTGCDTALEQD